MRADNSVDQDQPEWDKERFTAYQKVLDEFQKYDNTAGVFVGNEVLNQGTSRSTHLRGMI